MPPGAATGRVPRRSEWDRHRGARRAPAARGPVPVGEGAWASGAPRRGRREHPSPRHPLRCVLEGPSLGAGTRGLGRAGSRTRPWPQGPEVASTGPCTLPSPDLAAPVPPEPSRLGLVPRRASPPWEPGKVRDEARVFSKGTRPSWDRGPPPPTSRCRRRGAGTTQEQSLKPLCRGRVATWGVVWRNRTGRTGGLARLSQGAGGHRGGADWVLLTGARRSSASIWGGRQASYFRRTEDAGAYAGEADEHMKRQIESRVCPRGCGTVYSPRGGSGWSPSRPVSRK